ncbi:MAG: GNAT family N-acetyltransferase, partial [Caldilineaceae bacterium]|nr:GNAT family N-acetyltransferase [Caldilineaceae bacterium]
FRSLFRTDEPQAKRCFAVLEGSTAGRMFTDDLVNPTWGVVQEGYDNCIYLGGTVDETTITGVIDHLRQSGDVCIGLWPDDQRFDRLSLPTLYGHWVREFYDRPVGKGLDAYLHGVPEDCVVQRMDRDLIMRSAWGPDDVASAGGIDQWEATCFGYCLLQDNEILAEATVGPGALRLREPGVFTQAAHRGKGYGTIVTAFLIQEIESLGEQTYWNCTKENVASAGIARKLGYQTEKAYRLWGWEGQEH